MKKEVIIITGAGIVIGLAEALIYYNMGRKKDGKFSYTIPPAKELAQTLGIVVVTSIATAMLTEGIERMLGTDKALVLMLYYITVSFHPLPNHEKVVLLVMWLGWITNFSNSEQSLTMDHQILETLGYAILFILIVVALIFLRRKNFELKNSDVLFGFSFITLLLFLNGEIQELSWADIKIIRALEEVYESPVKGEISPLFALEPAPVGAEVERIYPKEKAHEDTLAVYERKGITAISFKLGYSNYQGDAIEKYLTQLTKLKTIVIESSDRKFYAMIEASALRDFITNSTYSWGNFKDWIEKEDEHQNLTNIPSFNRNSIMDSANLEGALSKFDQFNTDQLVVVDESGVFIGTLDKSRVSSNLLLSIAKKLKSTKGQTD